MGILSFIRTWWTESKIYLARAASYAIILNSLGIIFLVLDKLKVYGINLDLKIYGPIVVILGLVGMIIIGYLDTKLGFFEYEAKRNTDRNPYLMEIVTKVREINTRLERLENSLHKSDLPAEETNRRTGQ